MSDTVQDYLDDEVMDGKPHPGRRMTEDEFVAWCDDKTRAEWVDGEVIVMSPVNLKHSDLGWFLMSLLKLVVVATASGVVFGPEVQFRLGPGQRRRMPDVMFVRKERTAILRPTVIDGAPDLVIEIVSPDSVERDWREKYEEYEAARISEYWIVDPAYERVRAYAIGEQDRYVPIEPADGWLRSMVVPGFAIKPEWLWQSELPNLLAVVKDLRVG